MHNHRTLKGPQFTESQARLAHFNRRRLTPSLAGEEGYRDLEDMAFEEEFIGAALAEVAPLLPDVPDDADGFVQWFEDLKVSGPGQNDPLFPWLADEATLEQMVWFLRQEIAGEAGFDDLVALTQVKMPRRAKLEMARNYWDEMGRGNAKGMHGPLLERLADHLGIEATTEGTVPEALALGNALVALACHRRYAFHSVGALGVIELTAPTRATYVVEGLRRLGVPSKVRHYFTLHAILDVKHSTAWNEEVLRSLVAEEPRCARAIAQGAMLRLWCGKRCFDRYRVEFGLIQSRRAA